MPVPDETLRAIIRDLNEFQLSNDELELVRPEIDNYLSEIENLRDLDLSDVLSSRLLRLDEGGLPHA